MKRILYILLIISFAFLTACGESDLKRAERLVNEFDATEIPYAKGLKAIGRIRLDSASIQYAHLPAVVSQIHEAKILSAENQEVLAELKRPIASEVAYNILRQRLWQTGTRVEELQSQLAANERQYKPRIPGWMVYHRFRTLKTNGAMRMHEYLIYFDKGITRITAIVNLSDSLPTYRKR
ncbi:MAG: hypothetical protein WCQ86_03255 [Bacteroidaceae bacterium]